MIVSRTPLRISFFSGGSDMPTFYNRETGAALSVTIDKYIYVMAHATKYSDHVVLMHEKVEKVNDVEAMEHDITREALLSYGIDKGITIASISDVTCRGSGLGASSAYAVGLINAITTLQSKPTAFRLNIPRDLADLACELEMHRCGYPVGRQDQYAAAFGGLNLYEFHAGGMTTTVRLNQPASEIIPQEFVSTLERNLLLVHSGRERSANAILQKHQEAMLDDDKFELVRRMKNKAFTGMNLLINGDVDSFGALLDEAWQEKRDIVNAISDPYFDNIYNTARASGALGGKLLGAGGGGFFIFYAPHTLHETVRDAILNVAPTCTFYDFKFTSKGSTIMASA